MAEAKLKDAIATRQIDTERVRVTEYRFPPGSHTGWHRHEFDYVVVPMRGGPLRLAEKAGERIATLVTGQAYTREAGVEHDVINDGPGEVVFVEVEMKPEAR
ncbi:MAG: cupin domain-containing protein [Proteobacteria bacterium]|nr:cupin domain-containing protein [Pseudomonadota bacterium]MBI3497757.1 cupin domain-containing protein [Pseudomonadota bacterium]